eukprot:756141-Hanusia_phi.AAC.3
MSWERKAESTFLVYVQSQAHLELFYTKAASPGSKAPTTRRHGNVGRSFEIVVDEQRGGNLFFQSLRLFSVHLARARRSSRGEGHGGSETSKPAGILFPSLPWQSRHRGLGSEAGGGQPTSYFSSLFHPPKNLVAAHAHERTLSWLLSMVRLRHVRGQALLVGQGFVHLGLLFHHARGCFLLDKKVTGTRGISAARNLQQETQQHFYPRSLFPPSHPSQKALRASAQARPLTSLGPRQILPRLRLLLPHWKWRLLDAALPSEGALAQVPLLCPRLRP